MKTFLQVGIFDVIFHFGQWEAIERTGNGQRVSAHIFKHHHIVDLHVGQQNAFAHLHRRRRQTNKQKKPKLKSQSNGKIHYEHGL